jgi:hypothetical protein
LSKSYSSFQISFLINNPYKKNNGPCYDIYNVLIYNTRTILPDKLYKLNQVKLNIDFGSSKTNEKIINLYYFPKNVNYTVILKENPWTDTFKFVIENNKLIITRMDSKEGWGYEHSCDIVFKCNENIYLFKEVNHGDWRYCYVTYKENKIFNSHNLEYISGKF